MEETPGSYEQRFAGMSRLLGDKKAEVLRQSHVAVVGIGGVGSWAVESLARSGIGTITMIDWDDVCYSNVNRQVHALDGSIGKSKVDVMADRIKSIQPGIKVNALREFFTEESREETLSMGFDVVIDAIDKLTPKCWLIAGCRRANIPVIAIGAAGGSVDPTRIVVADLNRSHSDPLLAQVRAKLKKDFGFTKNPKGRFKVECVFSSEHKVFPQGDGTVCTKNGPHQEGANLGCDFGYGSASWITGTFAFMAVSRVIRRLTFHIDNTPSST
jgi:tRNA threonylcarbamoyladenosine dehydratase